MALRTRIGLLVAAVAVAIPSISLTAGQQRGASAGPFVPGEILVTFRPGTAANARADIHRQAGGERLAELTQTRVHRVRVAAGDESAAIARYQRNPNVLYAEPNFIRHIPMPLAHGPGTEVVPHDYYFDEQWGLHNTGQQFYCFPWISGQLCLNGGTARRRHRCTRSVGALDRQRLRHPRCGDRFGCRLQPSRPGGELHRRCGLRLRRRRSDGRPRPRHSRRRDHCRGDEQSDRHSGREEGVVGVAPNARILAYKVCAADGSCTDFAVQQAIAQAVIDGARVINMSLGDTIFSQSLNDAVQAAWNAGLVIVAGAGNDGTTAPFYPAALDNVISVAAFDEDHRRASFSTYGPWVDIAAPGNVIMSTYPGNSCAASTVPGDVGCYTWNSGTSMATPYVAGAAALIWSRNDVTRNSQVVEIVLNSADAQGVDAVRLDSWTVHGGLNLHNALDYVLTAGPAPWLRPACLPHPCRRRA